MNQKFKKYDLVMIDKDLGQSMSHFVSGIEAIVMGSYADQYGGGDTNSFTLYIKGQGETSWYYENQLSLIKSDAEDIYLQWKSDHEKRHEELSSLDYIFSHPSEFEKGINGASAVALGKVLGINDFYGGTGEGFVFYENAMNIYHFAKPYIMASDKDGFIRAATK